MIQKRCKTDVNPRRAFVWSNSSDSKGLAAFQSLFPVLAALLIVIQQNGLLNSSLQAEEISLPGLSARVEVYLDEYSIPHVYAQSWQDASRVLGYLHASERLWQMDMLRRQSSGNLSEVIGPEGLPSDKLMRQLGIRSSCQELWDSDRIPSEMRAEFEAYAAGVNQKIKELGTEKLPMAFQALEYQPDLWEPVDSLVFSKYMGWDQSGTLDDLWFGSLVEKLGSDVLEELWPIDRPYEQPTVTVQADRAAFVRGKEQASLSQTQLEGLSQDWLPTWKYDIAAGEQNSGQRAGKSSGQFTNAESGSLFKRSNLADAFDSLHRRIGNVGWFGRGSSFGSNNWAVSGSKTRSGKPIVCNDPHLSFTIPSIWYTAHLCVQGQNIAGVTFPGAPTIVIGHNDRIAWGLTNIQADAVDFFVETTDLQNPQRYLHRGEWKEMTRRVETIAVRGAEPQELVIDSTIHGPILERDPAAISICWTGFGPTTDSVAFWKITHANNIQEFLTALDYLEVPAMNIVYGDVDGNIAMHCCGRLPLRTRGHGRIPMDGASGDFDWNGWIPRDKLPLAINPPEQFVASANGRPHPVGYPYYLGWMWDPSYRTRRIKNLLTNAGDLTQDSMRRIQFDHFDTAASRFLPVMLKAVEEPLNEASEPALAQAALEAVRNWNYVANRDSTATAVWLRWFEKYRDNVWSGLWVDHDFEHPSGSWGFTGDNRREPTLEVLEFLTREMPESRWFDDRRTPERETRDTVIRKSFIEAVVSLKDQFGADFDQWAWKHINGLKIESLLGDPRLNVEGVPVVGTAFTLNPGGNVGPVESGASWRMIVDFGMLDQSMGVYPGGQSENPAGGHYADQIPLWAQGQYIPLNPVGSPELLPESAKKSQMTFK